MRPNVWCKSFRFMRGLGRFQAACKQLSVDAGLEAICGKLSDVSRTRQASGILDNFRGSSGASLGFSMHVRGHLQAFSATIIATCRQFMHLSKNMFRQRQIRELSGTFCGQFEAILQAFSVSLGVSCQSSGILRQHFTFWVAMWQFLVQLVLARKNKKGREGVV